jgi:porphobilinogen synthase
VPNHHNIVGSFPQTRLRRVRRWSWSRRLIAENSLQVSDLIYPVFVRTEDTPAHIPSMPGVQRYTIQELPQLMDKLSDLGVPAVCLFPVIPASYKNETADECLNPDSLLPRAIRIIKQCNADIGVITDAALDAFTSHGHDGLVFNGDVDNDRTLERMAQHALLQAQAGADIIAPSDMMDGRVAAIRTALDEEDYQHVGILSYSAKYASAYYGPFRDALQSAGCLGQANKKTYQMDPANAEEALREVAQDLAEGADMVMVKPGLPYLDVIYRIRTQFQVPTIAYQVSGEYAMLCAAANAGWLNYEDVLYESLLAFKRAGAYAIITYAALDMAKKIQEQTQ